MEPNTYTEMDPETGLPARILQFSPELIKNSGGMKELWKRLLRPDLTRKFLPGDETTAVWNGLECESCATPVEVISSGHIFG